MSFVKRKKMIKYQIYHFISFPRTKAYGG